MGGCFLPTISWSEAVLATLSPSHFAETQKSHLPPGGFIFNRPHIRSSLVSDHSPPRPPTARLAWLCLRLTHGLWWNLGHAVLTQRHYAVFSLFTRSPALRLLAESRLAPRRVLLNQEPNTYSPHYTPEVSREIAPLEGDAGSLDTAWLGSPRASGSCLDWW